jgi:hypothetical protein
MPPNPPLESMATTSPDVMRGAVIRHDRIRIRELDRRTTAPIDVGNDRRQIEAFTLRNRVHLEDRRDHHLVGQRQALGELLLEHGAAQGV